MTMHTRIIRLPDVRQRTGLSRSQILRLEASGSFPCRVQLCTRAVGWVEDEIEGWLLMRISLNRRKRVAPNALPSAALIETAGETLV